MIKQVKTEAWTATDQQLPCKTATQRLNERVNARLKDSGAGNEAIKFGLIELWFYVRKHTI